MDQTTATIPPSHYVFKLFVKNFAKNYLIPAKGQFFILFLGEITPYKNKIPGYDPG